MAVNYPDMKLGTGSVGTGGRLSDLPATPDEAQARIAQQMAGLGYTDLGGGRYAPAGWQAPAPLSSDPFAALRTSRAGLHDSALGSRTFMNPNVGKREAVAVGSVYQRENIPDYLTAAVAQLNQTQAKRAADQEIYRRNLLGLATGPNAYLVAPALAASAVAPGRSVTIAGDAFQNPLVGKAKSDVATAQKSTVDLINSEIASRQRKIADLKQKISTAWGPSAQVQRGDLVIQLGNEERELRDLQNSALAKGVAGWVANTPK